MNFTTINNVQADAHAFRVTLNLVLHSEVCPLDLAAVIENLRDEHDWNRHKLTKLELESIYAHLDNEVCAKALEEWDAETYRMRDWGFPFWRPDYNEWWDGENHAVDCKLCGHKHNRYEFPVVNRVNGNEIWTGSTCIVKYGVTVDGDACAETAIAKLRDIMGRSKNAQKRHEWEKAHPEAESAIDRVREALPVANRKYLPWSVQRACDAAGDRILPHNFESQRKLLGKWGRAAVKYYDKNGMLTPQRTEELWEKVGDNWEDGPMLRVADLIVAKYAEATENDPTELARKYWEKFIADHPHMNDYQRRQVEYFRRNGYGRGTLYRRNLDLVAEIEQQHKARANRKADDPAATNAAAAAKAAAVSKLPWS